MLGWRIYFYLFLTSPYSSTFTILATGGSAMKAVEVLMAEGVLEDRIIFVNLVGPF